MLNKLQISGILSLLENAGKEILNIYKNEDYYVRMKEDNSPVTIADINSDRIIKNGLRTISPEIPVFSEETKEVSYDIRSKWNQLWILDPLDGTKEFISGNGEFCISLALVSASKPVMGFIHAPVTSESWFAIKDKGAFKMISGEKAVLPVYESAGPIKITISRSHHSESEAAWIRNYEKYHSSEIQVQGSAVKFCRIAEGLSDVYPKFGIIHEWDVAAGNLIIEEAGGIMLETATGKTPVYNKKNYFQPPFIAFGKRIIKPERYLFSEFLEGL
jgi:3'(2'),5'-bisphosphate nucleotidase